MEIDFHPIFAQVNFHVKFSEELLQKLLMSLNSIQPALAEIINFILYIYNLFKEINLPGDMPQLILLIYNEPSSL
jgi:hypothetical protein